MKGNFEKKTKKGLCVSVLVWVCFESEGKVRKRGNNKCFGKERILQVRGKLKRGK